MKTLLAALLLLVVGTGTAFAECAWVLWQQQGKLAPDGSVLPWDWVWLPVTGRATESECRKAAERVDASLGSKDADGHLTIVCIRNE